MGSLELLSYFGSLNTIPVVKIQNFDFGHLRYPPIIRQYWQILSFYNFFVRIGVGGGYLKYDQKW